MLQKEKSSTAPTKITDLSDDLTLKGVASKNKEFLNKLDKNNFKTAEELMLTQLQYDSLVKTLELMESGIVNHVASEHDRRSGDYNFNMSTWKEKWNCGTVACLGGTAELVSGLPRGNLFHKKDPNTGKNVLDLSPELVNLFFVGHQIEHGCHKDTTDTQAARALRGYLETGKTDWVAARSKP